MNERSVGTRMTLKPVLGFEGYAADDAGQIWKVASRRSAAEVPHVLTPAVGAHGYLTVRCFRGSKGATMAVHTLVALAFHGPRPPHSEVRHLNGNKTDNEPRNLAWGSAKENTADRARHGRLRTPRGPGRGRRVDVTFEEVQKLHKQGLSINQIAKRLGVWWGTVKKRLHG